MACVVLAEREAGQGVTRPRDGVHDIAIPKYNVENAGSAAGCKDPMHLCLKADAILDIHGHVLQEYCVESCVLERQMQPIADLECDTM